MQGQMVLLVWAEAVVGAAHAAACDAGVLDPRTWLSAALQRDHAGLLRPPPSLPQHNSLSARRKLALLGYTAELSTALLRPLHQTWSDGSLWRVQQVCGYQSGTTAARWVACFWDVELQ